MVLIVCPEIPCPLHLCMYFRIKTTQRGGLAPIQWGVSKEQEA